MTMSITVELLDALLSPSPQQAEALLQTMSVQDRARGLLSLLLQLDSQQPSPNNAGREMMASVLLRRDISNLQDVNLLKEMVEPLLKLFCSSGTCRRQLGHCLAEICASLSFLSQQESNEVVDTIVTRIAPACSTADVESLRLVASIADRAPMALYKNAQTLPSLFTNALGELQTGQSLNGVEALLEAIVEVGIAAQTATSSGGSFASSILTGVLQDRANDGFKVDPSSPVSQLGRTCLEPLLEMLKSALQSRSSSDDNLCKCMQHLSHAASSCPSLLAGNGSTFHAVVETCMTTAISSFLETKTRLSSLEVLATICEIDDVKRGILSPSNPNGLQLRNMLLLGSSTSEESNNGGVVRICTEFIVNGVDEDVEAWANDPATLVDDPYAWEEDDDAVYAESLLTRFLQNVGGALVVVLPLVEMLLLQQNWKHQRAAVAVLFACLQAAPVTFSQHMPVATETALRLCSSINVRVQFQAMLLLGALCETDNRSDLRRQYGSRILEAACHLVQSRCTKVASIACLAIVSYCRGGGSQDTADRSTLVVPYLEGILRALVTSCLSSNVGSAPVNVGVVTVKVRAIGAVACLAEASGESFVPFYTTIMPGLIGCCAQISSNSHELSMLGGAAMEAATIVGQAIGQDNRALFVGDAEQIMNIALPLLNDDSAASMMIPMDQLLSACARIATIMGDSYAPFIPSVLPHLLKRAVEPADVSITEGDEAGLEASKLGDFQFDDEEGTESLTLQIPGRGLKKVTINTTKMQEKSLASRAVYEHAAALGASFGPYAESTMHSFLPLVTFQYSSDVRSTAAQALSAIYESACLYDEASNPGKMQVPSTFLPLLAKSISSQILKEDFNDTEVIYALADSLSEIYYSTFRRLAESNGNVVAQFSTNDADATVKELMKAIKACLDRRSKIIQTLQGHNGALTGDDEREEYSEKLLSEQEILTPLVDCVGYTLKFFREAFVPIFAAEVAPVLEPLLGPAGHLDSRARFAAVCLFDDCVEHCGGAAAAKYAPMLAKGIVYGLAQEQDSQLKAVSIYGICQIARNAPSDILVPYQQQIMEKLLSICNVSKEDTDDVSVLEYAVSALGSLVLYGKSPFSNVKIKDNIAKTFLNHLPILEDEDEAKVCHSGLCEMIENKVIDVAKETSAVLYVIGGILVEDLASPDTCARFGQILSDMQRNISADKMQHAFAALPPERQNAVVALANQHAMSHANVVTP